MRSELNQQLVPSAELLFEVQVTPAAPDLAFTHDCYAVAQLVRFIHVVRGEDNDSFFFDFLENVPQFVLGGEVHPR